MHTTKPEITPVAREANFRTEREFALRAANHGPATIDPNDKMWQPAYRSHTDPEAPPWRVPRRSAVRAFLTELTAWTAAACILGGVVGLFTGRLHAALQAVVG